jgi:Uma2 family endonuclease
MATAELNAPSPSVPRREPYPRPWTEAEFRTMQALGLFPGRRVELIGGQVVERAPGDPVPRPVVFTRKEYYALGDANLFRGQRVQLIGGVVVEESPMMDPPHATTIRKASRRMEQVFASGYDVRAQLPLDLGLIHEPEPDIAVVTGSPDDYATDHPHAAVVVIEVADTTLEEDTHAKANLYAAAGIADYWVLDLVNRRLLVFRDPKPAPSEQYHYTYGRLTGHGPDETVTPLAAPAGPVRVADLLP